MGEREREINLIWIWERYMGVRKGKNYLLFLSLMGLICRSVVSFPPLLPHKYIFSLYG